jgi:short-subunit dehydrogenase
VSQFFETLRIELGDAISITIFQPGVIKSEMTDGKSALADGKMTSSEEAPDRRKVQTALQTRFPEAGCRISGSD